MRTYKAIATAAIALTFGAGAVLAQAAQDDGSRAIKDGGVFAKGWAGKIDAKEVAAGLKLENSKLTMEGNALKVTTGPAVTYWNPANKASGNYSVKAKFREPAYMNINNHPHPYGIVIAGNDMGTDNQSYLYCAAYGDGRFIVRGMGPAPFQMNGRGAPNPAINKAAGKGQPVEQEIEVMVHGDKVTCSVNGTVVGEYAKADLVAEGKLKSLDGVYGIRFAHNTDGIVTDLKLTKH